MFSTSSSTSCADLHDQSQGQFGWSVIVLVGTIISNVPQQYRILRKWSAEGISSYFLLTGIVSATSGLANITILSLDIFDCCHSGQIDQYECSSAVMGVAVYGVQWLVFFVMYVSTVHFSQVHIYIVLPSTYHRPLTKRSLLFWSIVLPTTKWQHPEKPHATVRDMILTNALWLAHLILTFVLFALLYHFARRTSLITYADALGIISAIVAALQYAPQIWTTYRLKHIGSISIPWLIIQTPGGLASMAALIGRPGTDWTTWLSGVGTFLGQAVLLVVCCCWAWRDWRARKREERQLGLLRTNTTEVPKTNRARRVWRGFWRWIFD
jgi:uncharacterized protein with PQ loop repeat